MKRIIITLALLALLLPQTASAAPRCPNGGTWTPNGCVYVVRGRSAVWPIVWPVGGRTAVSIDPEVQP